jgi:hypothetical protein
VRSFLLSNYTLPYIPISSLFPSGIWLIESIKSLITGVSSTAVQLLPESAECPVAIVSLDLSCFNS